MTPLQVVFLPWALLGVVLPVGLWLSLGAVLALAYTAHYCNWGVGRFTGALVLACTAYTAVNILFLG